MYVFWEHFPICMLADCRKVWKQVSRSVYHEDIEDYLTDFYPTFQSILKLYYSLAAVNNEANESGKTEFTLNLILKKLIYQP